AVELHRGLVEERRLVRVERAHPRFHEVLELRDRERDLGDVVGGREFRHPQRLREEDSFHPVEVGVVEEMLGRRVLKGAARGEALDGDGIRHGPLTSPRPSPEGEGARQSVTAPWLALPTSFAYLPRT